MVCVVLYNDGQFTHQGTCVIGVFDDVQSALVFAWKTLLEATLKPWNIQHYKKQLPTVAIGSYSVQQWDVAVNKLVKTYKLGERIVNRTHDCVLDMYLKEHHEDCDILLQKWYDHVVAFDNIHCELQRFTFE